MNGEKSDYIGYFSMKYQRLTYEYLMAVFLSFAYLFLIIYTMLNNQYLSLEIRLILLGMNLFAILIFNIGMRRVYIESISEIEKKMSQLMNVYYPGISKDLKEFGLVMKEISNILKGKEKKK